MALTIRLNTDEEKDLLEKLKDVTGEYTGTKALMKAAKMVVEKIPEYEQKIRLLNQEVTVLEEQNSDIKKLVKRKYYLDAELSEVSKSLKNAITL